MKRISYHCLLFWYISLVTDITLTSIVLLTHPEKAIICLVTVSVSRLTINIFFSFETIKSVQQTYIDLSLNQDSPENRKR